METLASMLLAAKDADLVVASRYLPGADASPVTNSQGLRQDFHNWRVSTGKIGCRVFLPRLADCTDLGSTCFLFHRSLLEDLQIPAEGLPAPGRPLLLEILVRSPWTRLTETPLPRVRVGRSACAASSVSSPRRGRCARFAEGREGTDRCAIATSICRRVLTIPSRWTMSSPMQPELAGKQRRRLLWTIGSLALALRIILLPIGHWWDLTVDYNTFIDLAHNVSPLHHHAIPFSYRLCLSVGLQLRILRLSTGSALHLLSTGPSIRLASSGSDLLHSSVGHLCDA